MGHEVCTFCETLIPAGEAEYLPAPGNREPEPVCSECWCDHAPPDPETDWRYELILDP